MAGVCCAIGLLQIVFVNCRGDLAELVGAFVVVIVDKGKLFYDVFGYAMVGGTKFRKTCIVIPQLGIDVA